MKERFFRYRLAFTLLFGALLFGCATSHEARMKVYNDYSQGEADMGGTVYENDMRGAKGSDVLEANTAPSVEEATPAPTKTTRKVIYTANFSILVVSHQRAIDDFLASVTTLGGHLSQRQDNTLTVRVPAANFSTLTDSLSEYGAIASQNISSQDVTDAFVDLELRLANAKNARARLLVLIQNATKTEDLLKIEREITRLSEVIETLEGQRRQMADRIALSTVTVRFFQNSVEPIPVHQRKRSRFEWINLVGVENALQNH